MTPASLSVFLWHLIRFSTLSTSEPQTWSCSSSIYRQDRHWRHYPVVLRGRSDLQRHVTDLLVGSVSNILQLSDEAVDHQHLLQLLLVVVQIAMKLTPPEEGFDCQTGSSREVGGGRWDSPVVELLPPLPHRQQLLSALPPLQSGCQSVDGGDMSVVHRHVLHTNMLSVRLDVFL